MNASGSTAIPVVETAAIAVEDSACQTACVASVPTTRFYYMDAMRGVLMMLGVVLHAAYVFSPTRSWVISDPQSSRFLEVFSEYMRLFRMPAFFVISGFFAMMSLQRYSIDVFLRVRLKRIVLPLVSAALTLNVAQIYFVERFVNGNTTSLSEFFTKVLPERMIAGDWVQHLWFLNTLIFFFVAAVVIFLLMPLIPQSWKQSRLLDSLRQDCRFMLILPVTLLGWDLVERLGHGWADTPLLCGFLNLDEFAIYFPYFVLGLWLYVDHKLRDEFQQPATWQLWSFVPCLVVYASLRGVHGLHITSVLREYSEVLFILLCTQLCFIGFQKYADRNSPYFRYFADASYTVYLFHHIFVVMIGTLLMPVNVMPVFKFLVIATSSLMITLVIHHFLILRVPLLRLMFNGK
ncbi:MAG: acyltransferase family protein [Planctomycetaceae bacterium]|nr:acyltransferase family protein [Planctomycetaceae bacterium]